MIKEFFVAETGQIGVRLVCTVIVVVAVVITGVAVWIGGVGACRVLRLVLMGLGGFGVGGLLLVSGENVVDVGEDVEVVVGFDLLLEVVLGAERA